MFLDVTVIEVLIASPSDVQRERDVLTDVVNGWNSANSRANGIILLPRRWEFDVVPDAGAEPQAVVNKQIVDSSDVLLGIFWHRLGSPTKTEPSGTAEEIERMRKAGKRIALYFSQAAIPQDHDPDQFRKLQEYKKSISEQMIFAAFKDPEQLFRLASTHLARIVNELSPTLGKSPQVPVHEEALPLEYEVEGAQAPQYLVLTHPSKFRVVAVEFLAENSARIDVEAIQHNLERVTHRIPIDPAKLMKIHNLKPRSGREGIPLRLRIKYCFADEDKQRSQTIDLMMEPNFMMLNNAHTYFMRVLG